MDTPQHGNTGRSPNLFPEPKIGTAELATIHRVLTAVSGDATRLADKIRATAMDALGRLAQEPPADEGTTP